MTLMNIITAKPMLLDGITHGDLQKVWGSYKKQV